MTDSKNANVDMRSRPDFIAKSIKYYVITAWILGLSALVLTLFTVPSFKAFLNTYLHLRLPLKVDLAFNQINFGLFAVTFLVSITGIWVNSSRNRRRTDRFHSSLILICILSGLGTLLLLVLNSINYFSRFR